MPVSLPASFAARLSASVQYPVYALRLDLLGDVFCVWTGGTTLMPSNTTDPALNGQVFEGLSGAPLINVGPVSTARDGVEPVTISLGAADLNQDAAMPFLRDRRVYQGRSAYLWEGRLDENQTNASLARLYTGVISHMRFQDSGDDAGASISVTLDRDLRLLRRPEMRIGGHANVWPGDVYGDFMADAANKPAGPNQDAPLSSAWAGVPPDFFERGFNF